MPGAADHRGRQPARRLAAILGAPRQQPQQPADRGEERPFPDIQDERPAAQVEDKELGIFAKIRQVYERLCERKEASADRMRQEPLSEQADEFYKRERQIAVERDSKLLGLNTNV